MIVSHKHRFIFIKTRKTAGTSVEIALSQFCGEDDILSMMSPEDEELRAELGFRGPQHYLKNPGQYSPGDWWQRLRGEAPRRFYNHAPAALVRDLIGQQCWDSYFKFCFDRNPYDKAVSKYFWSTKKKRRPPDMNQWLQTCPQYKVSNWGMYSLDGELAMDYVGRFEHLQQDLQSALRRIGISQEPYLPHTKGKTRRDQRHYCEVLDEATRARLQRVCHNEIQLLNYHW